jgi:hypothetical protein
VEPVALFILTSISSLFLHVLSRYITESKLAVKIITPGIAALFSLWIGLFLDVAEMEGGEWIAVFLVGLFLHGLSAFFLFLLQMLRERFLHLPELPLSTYTLEPVFLNLTCLGAILINQLLLIVLESAISLATIIALFLLFPIYTFYYYFKYKDIEYIPQSSFLTIFILFSILFLLYFVVGMMCLFILSPFGMPELK